MGGYLSKVIGTNNSGFIGKTFEAAGQDIWGVYSDIATGYFSVGGDYTSTLEEQGLFHFLSGHTTLNADNFTSTRIMWLS